MLIGGAGYAQGEPMKLDAAMRHQATRDLIETQLSLYPHAPRLRLEIAWGPDGIINAGCTPLPEGETPDEPPRFQKVATYKAWSQYTIEDDRSRYLIKRLGQ